MVSPKLRRTQGGIRSTDDRLAALDMAIQDFSTEVVNWARPGWCVCTPVGNYQAKPWDLVVAQSALTVLLPPATIDNRGTEIRVIRATSASIIVAPITGLVDGAATSSGPSANRTKTYTSSGIGWHSDG